MRTHSIRGLLLLACSALTAPALAQLDPNNAHVTWPANAPRPLEYFDVRLLPDGLQQPWVIDALAASRSPAALEARARDAQSLLQSIPLLRIDDHEFFGTPHWVASTAQFLTPVVPPSEIGKFDSLAVIREFVAAHPGLFEIDASELDVARMERDFYTDHNGARHLTYQQQIGGVDLVGCELRANVTRLGQLMNVSSSMLPRPAGDFDVAPIVLTPLGAMRAAARNSGTTMGADPAPLGSPEGASQLQTWAATRDFRTDVPITTRLVYFPRTRDDIHPAWLVVLPQIGPGNTYETMVDASDGSILRRWNQLHFAAAPAAPATAALGGTQDLTVNVYTKDSPAPGSPGNATNNGFQFPFVLRSLVTVTPASVPQSLNSWINDGDNDTQGNNVDAHLDLNNDNMPDLPRPTGSPFRVFDFPQDNLQPPTSWRDAAVVSLFYHCNRYHDVLRGFGFNEASKNFQTDNFGLGGTGNDRVQADSQDGGGTNNANFGTSGGDGTSARMQQYIFTCGTATDRDSSLDADIIYHEHSHGLSIRLHNGTVSGAQAGGMGEGWGDYFGCALSADSTDDTTQTYHTGGYATYLLSATFVDNYYFGIRRFPYSIDLNKNPQTYADLDPAQQAYPPAIPRSPVIGNTANEVHNVGEVWCGLLLEVRHNLWQVHGFAANDLLMQLVVDGMKLDPATPNFLQARDAILQADLNNNGGANHADIWAGFAKRGCGFSATSPAGSTTSGIVEAYDVPTLIIFTYPNGTPTQMNPGQPRTFQVSVAGLGSVQPLAGTGQLFRSVNGGAFIPSAMTQTSPNNYHATIPAANCLDVVRYYVQTATTSGTATDPGNAPTTTKSATVFTGITTIFSDDVETNQGWTLGAVGDAATTGIWTRVDPVGTAAQPEDDHTGAPGVTCFVTGQGAVGGAVGAADVDGGQTTLTSPTLNLGGQPEAMIAYWRWYSNDQGGAPQADIFRVDVSNNNGTSWVSAEVVGPTGPGTHGTWIYHEFRVADFVPPTSTVRVRFIAEDFGTGSVIEAGIDDFSTLVSVCGPPLGTNFCAGDGGSGACPCGNSGVSGNGCNNSVGTGGSRLGASGTVTPDTVVLSATGELSTALSIFLQGNLPLGSPATFGDGLRCAGGTLKRLYTKNAVGGLVSAPGSGDPSVSAQSAALGDTIAPGTSRHYQTYYRDASGTFCPDPPGNTYNVSNGVTIVW